MTKKEMLAAFAERYSKDVELVTFCNDEIEKIEKKAEKTKERATQKREEGDELYNAVIACVKDTPLTANDIYENNFMHLEDVTVAKVRARLTKGVKKGVLVKENLKGEDEKVKMHYAKA